MAIPESLDLRVKEQELEKFKAPWLHLPQLTGMQHLMLKTDVAGELANKSEPAYQQLTGAFRDCFAINFPSQCLLVKEHAQKCVDLVTQSRQKLQQPVKFSHFPEFFMLLYNPKVHSLTLIVRGIGAPLTELLASTSAAAAATSTNTASAGIRLQLPCRLEHRSCQSSRLLQWYHMSFSSDLCIDEAELSLW